MRFWPWLSQGNFREADRPCLLHAGRNSSVKTTTWRSFRRLSRYDDALPTGVPRRVTNPESRGFPCGGCVRGAPRRTWADSARPVLTEDEGVLLLIRLLRTYLRPYRKQL